MLSGLSGRFWGFFGAFWAGGVSSHLSLVRMRVKGF